MKLRAKIDDNISTKKITLRQLITQVFPHPNLQVSIESIHPNITFYIKCKRKTGVCPNCGKLSSSIHSKYLRKLQDRPISNICVIVNVMTRKFKCHNPDREVWAKIGSIEKKGLLVVERDSNGYKSRVLRFTLPHMLKKDFIDERVLTNDLDFISFSLLQRTKNNQVCRSDYAGTFYLDRSVKLNKNVEYVYEGYINTDGSLTLKIQPLYNVENNFNIK